MSMDLIRNALLWCAAINYGMLALWALLFILLHDGLHRLTRRWFRLSAEQFDAFNYGGILLYKVAIFLFNLAPYVALRLVG